MVVTIGYFTLDNASNNDSALVEISSLLLNINIVFDPIKRRLCCFGHVINLVVKSFLWGTDVEAFRNELARCKDEDTEQGGDIDQITEWRK